MAIDSFVADSFIPDNDTGLERTPPQDYPGASATVPSQDIASWLTENLANVPGLKTVWDAISPNIGALAGGIAAPAAAGALIGGPPGLLAGMGAGAVGAMTGQSIQDLITKGAIDPMQTGIQGLLGAAGPLGGKFLSGAGTAIKGLGRMAGILPDIEQAALQGGRMAAEGIPDILTTLRGSTPAISAERAANFIEQKLGGGSAETAGYPKWLKDYITKQSGKPAPTDISMKDFQIIRDTLGGLTRDKSINPKVSGEAYKGVMDILRSEATNGNQAAVDMLQALAEKQGVRAITPSMTQAGIGGASGYGLWALTHRPGYVATAALAPYLAQAGSGLTKIGSMNPYLGAGVTTGEELLKSLLENQ